MSSLVNLAVRLIGESAENASIINVIFSPSRIFSVSILNDKVFVLRFKNPLGLSPRLGLSLNWVSPSKSNLSLVLKVLSARANILLLTNCWPIVSPNIFLDNVASLLKLESYPTWNAVKSVVEIISVSEPLNSIEVGLFLVLIVIHLPIIAALG